MSSTSTVPTPSDSSTPTQTTMSSSNNGGSRTIDFFGFLIAFVALLLVFVVCGLGSRRRFVARRRAMLADVDRWAFAPPVRQEQPKYWEPSLVPGGGDWSTTMPLSVSVLHDEAEVHDRRQVPRELPPQTFSVFPLSSWIPFVRANSGAPRPLGKLPEVAGGHQVEKSPDNLEVQVEVMITLPSTTRSLSDEESNRHRLPEYQIGSVRVLWEGQCSTNDT